MRPLFSTFELFIAKRYLRAKRKQAVISVITVISIVGVAVGVMALVISLAINTGFRNTLQRNLLGATAHVTVISRSPDNRIDNWKTLLPKLRAIPHVVQASGALWDSVYFSAGQQGAGGFIKGVPPGEQAAADVLLHLKAGSREGLDSTEGYPGIILGSALSQKSGGVMNSIITVIVPQGEVTPFGMRPSYYKYRVVGIFESGFFDLDSAFAFVSLASAQKALSVGDTVNSIELKLDDPNRAVEVAAEVERVSGGGVSATTWMEQNRQMRSALKMERIVTAITIGLIQLVAALNILITLVMMVMEKYRDVAVLMSLGARREQIRKIFMFQGVLIGVVGTVIGLIAGYSLCAAATYYRWPPLDAEVYALSYVPFEPQWIDGLWIAATAIGVSFIATIYPAYNATRVAPAEALRYE